MLPTTDVYSKLLFPPVTATNVQSGKIAQLSPDPFQDMNPKPQIKNAGRATFEALHLDTAENNYRNILVSGRMSFGNC